ncbi:MAG: filamentous hemagglutinin N-terminal domain-containing protein [Rhizonema sp. PD37]|nr:filamentous hemagglutinin N-terminal domain-containing protein [Rhizonema sp. PD37]
MSPIIKRAIETTNIKINFIINFLFSHYHTNLIRSRISTTKHVSSTISSFFTSTLRRKFRYGYVVKSLKLSLKSPYLYPNRIYAVLYFTRVTGGQASNILGTLGVEGSANLFLLNPNGIMFGPNARLDVRGSFLGTTANSFLFPQGIEFSATNPQAPPLLTINVPIASWFLFWWSRKSWNRIYQG